mmetsp:Transcript_8934/g.10092  ORF Transcript_8934/g.10092 Transcript_8934/m.10092 type:complete len:581 (+) Transcript_8934:14-1756(+)
MLALPPSDPSLYEESKTGVVFVAPLTIARMKRTGANGEEEIKTSGKKGGKGNDSDYDDSEEQKIMNDKFHEEWEKKRKSKTNREHETNTLLGDDHYQTLGLEDFGIAATEKHIKTAYRKLALEYHPDKGKKSSLEDNKDNDELNPEEKVKKEIWLKIQKAYETLMDPEKRRKYDSSLPFDESIPNEDEITDENFYDLFTDVFNRNAQWAKNKPVPQLGNHKTPIKKVMKFYKYWDTFETWRDFSNHDEYDLNEAADKYEKRWMDVENKKIRSKFMKVERARLNNLYRIAYKFDPRIRAENERLEKEKEQKKREKFEKKQKAKEERQRLQMEIQEKEDAEKRKIEQAKEQEKLKLQIQKQLRSSMIKKLEELAEQKLKKFHNEYDKFFIDDFTKKLQDEEITSLVTAVDQMADTEEGFVQIEEAFNKIKEQSEERLKSRQEKDKIKREEQKSKQKEWTREEYALLAKALNKYPGGTQDRWKTISIYMGDQYTTKDVLEMAKQLSQKAALASGGKGAFKNEPEKIIKSKQDEEEKKAEEGDNWSEADQKLLEEALKKYPKTMPAKERWVAIANDIPGKSAKE